MNQCSKILNHLMRKGSLTSAVAKDLYGIQNLSARIKNLRSLGLNVPYKDGAYLMPPTGKPKKKERIIEEDDLFPDYIG